MHTTGWPWDPAEMLCCWIWVTQIPQMKAVWCTVCGGSGLFFSFINTAGQKCRGWIHSFRTSPLVHLFRCEPAAAMVVIGSYILEIRIHVESVIGSGSKPLHFHLQVRLFLWCFFIESLSVWVQRNPSRMFLFYLLSLLVRMFEAVFPGS